MADPDSKIPYGFCQCGCGEKTKISPINSTRLGWTKGEPIQYINFHYNRAAKGEKNSRWKGGNVDCVGYRAVKAYGHPRNHNNYVLEHILKAEKALGKPLPPGVHVHHANGTRDSGELVICQDAAYHKLLHQRMRAKAACGHVHWRKCEYCKRYDEPTKLHIGKGHVYHHACVNEYKRKRKLFKNLSVTAP